MRIILSSLLLLVYAASAIAAEVPEIVRTCAEKNMPKTTAAQAIELTARDRSGYEQVLLANVYWKRDADNRSRLMMYFEEPADVRNARFLIIENQPQNDMYIYMPGLFKVRKITSRRISSSILGTDFSYEDYERLHGILTDLKAEQYPDDVLDGRPVYVIHSYPGETSGYDKIATYIDKETCVTLKAELFERGHQLRKTLTIDPADIQPVGDIQVPRSLVMRDVRDKTETRLVIREIRTGDPLDDALFDPETLKQQNIPPILTE
ncbi:MAG TPA: outer membrane lipoprotein-sorting protein [Gammaproteobacteria bacterium]|nr:outer membrane lipoprotein-sorting protein [Gammaproteobacteria bacterium]